MSNGNPFPVLPVAGTIGHVTVIAANGQLADGGTTPGGGSTNQVMPTATVAASAALPSNVYVNGTAGVGATLTASANGTLVVDGHLVSVGESVLVTKEATQSHNGLYVCTTAGTASVKYVLTRSTSMDSSAKFTGAVVPVGPNGGQNSNSLQYCQNVAPTVGTTAIAFTCSYPLLSNGTPNYVLTGQVSSPPTYVGELQGGDTYPSVNFTNRKLRFGAGGVSAIDWSGGYTSSAGLSFDDGNNAYFSQYIRGIDVVNSIGPANRQLYDAVGNVSAAWGIGTQSWTDSTGFVDSTSGYSHSDAGGYIGGPSNNYCHADSGATVQSTTGTDNHADSQGNVYGSGTIGSHANSSGTVNANGGHANTQGVTQNPGSYSSGPGAYDWMQNQKAFANGYNNAAGDAQGTDTYASWGYDPNTGAPVTLYADGNAASQLIVGFQTIGGLIIVIGACNDGSSYWSQTFTFICNGNAGALSTLPVTAPNLTGVLPLTWSVTFQVNNVGSELVILCQGDGGGQPINWTARIITAETAF
jgi:hypothetical protein